MPFQKGRHKTGGRTKGTPNKSSLLLALEDEQFNLVNNILELVRNPELGDETKVEVLVKLLEYVYPKKKTLDVTTISDEELKQVLIEKLKGDAK
jgi:hypothetical protein